MDFFDEGQNVDYGIMIMRRIFVLFFVVLGNWGMYLAFCQAYGYPRASRVIIVNIIFFAVLFAFIFSLPKRKCVIGFIAVFIVYFFRIYLRHFAIERQAEEILKYIRHRAYIYYNQSASSGFLSDVHYRSNSSGQALILSILFISVALMMASVLRGTRFVTIILMVSVLSADMLYGMTPEPGTALCLFVSAVGLCGMAQAKSGGNGKWKVTEGSGFSFSPLGFLAIAVMVSVFLGGVMYGALGKRILAKHEKYWKIQSNVELKVDEIATEIANRFERTRNNQKLSNDPPNQTGKMIMTIKTDKMPVNSIYLREQSSDTYNNNQWNSMVDYKMSNEDSLNLFSENYNIISKILTFTLSDANEILTSQERREIQNIKMEMEYSSNTSNLIFPYWANISGATSNSESDIIIPNGNDRSLSCSGVNFTFNLYDISDKIMMNLLNQSKVKLTDDSLYNDYITNAKKYYESYPNSLSGLTEFAKNIATVRMVTGGGEVQFGRQCSYIRNNIWNNVSYSKVLNKMPSGVDFTENFLLSEKQGYCVHYATAGTLLCRMKNLPARYVTGYRVDPSQFKKINNRDGSVSYMAEVLDTNGHAWTEVYKSYLGWVPVEMTEAENPDSAADYYDADEDENFKEYHDLQSFMNDNVDYPNNDDKHNNTDVEEDENNNIQDNTPEDDDTEENIQDESSSANDDVAGTKDESENNDGEIKNEEEPDIDEEKFRSVMIIILVVAVSFVLIVLLVRYIILQKRIKERREYERLDRSGKILMRARKVGKDSAKAVKLKYKTLDDRDILGVFMRIGDGEITKQEIEKLGSILERSAFAENEISEEKFTAAKLILDKIENKVRI